MGDPISFKNVGKTIQARSIEEPTSAPTPIGIRTPLRRGITATDGVFAMHYTIAEQVRDNLRNLLLTNSGERVGLIDFGANLQELALETTARETFETEAMQRIKQAVDRWMPFVSLKDFSLSQDFEDRTKLGAIVIKITYDVPVANDFDRQIEVVLFLT